MKGSRKIGRPVVLTAAAAALLASLSVGNALAYFTSYCEAEGSVAMNMGFTRTEIDEDVIEGEKRVTIRNTGDYDCFVRLQVFAPVDVAESGEDGWVKESDGYWYYSPVLSPGESTTVFHAEFKTALNGMVTKPEEFNIVVVSECTPVVYDDNGNPYGDWDYVITASDTEQEGVEDEE